MKKFVSLLILLLIATILPCSATEKSADSIFAEEADYIDENIDDTTDINTEIIIENTEEKSNIDERDEIIEAINPNSTILLRVGSKKYSLRKTFAFTEENLTEQKEAVRRFLDNVTEIIGGEPYKDSEQGFKVCDCVVDCRIEIKESPYSGKYQTLYGFTIEENCISGSLGGYIMDDYDELVDYIVTDGVEELSVLNFDEQIVINDEERYTFDFENNTATYKNEIEQSFTNIEKIQFDVTIDESYEDTIFEEVADIDTEVHCTVDNIRMGHSFYMLTLKGNKGKKTFVKEDYSWSFTGGDVLSFLTYHVLENNTSIIKGSSVKTDIIYIDGSVSDGSVSNVCIYLEPDDQPFKINSTNSIEVENITYEYFGTEEGLKDGRNIYWLFGIPEKEIYIQQQKEESEKYDVEEQDPERTVTKVKGVMKDGSVSGYKITFIAEIDVSTSMSDMPKWYTSLGDNVKATLVGFMRTIDGEEVRSYTMIRFSGSKDSVWFDNDTTMPWKKDEGKPITVDTTYKSLISFDGTEEVYNSVSHDNMSTRMQFTNDENMEVETITLGIGPVDITVKAEDIKYIGGGKATYEKLW